jgi:predicted DNA-binding transcriptional regulator AlpA
MNRKNAGKHLPAELERSHGYLTGPDDPGQPEPANTTTTSTDVLIGIREIRAMFRLGRTAAYELTHRPGFPSPVCISSRCYRWWATEVAAFAASLRQQSPAVRRPRRMDDPVHARDISAPHITGKVRMVRRRKEPS